MKPTISQAVLFAGLLLCLAGCGHDRAGHGHADHEPAVRQADAHQPSEHEAGHEGHGQGPALSLDDGKKWRVDDSTRESAARLTELVGAAPTIASVADARALGQALDDELDTLVKNCTMTGPAHDQLHVFLVAFFPRVTELKEETETSELQHARDQVASLLEAYDSHFE